MMNLLDLDFDSLINIFEFLSIYELIEVEPVCQTFKTICDAVYGGKRFHKMRIELRYLQTKYFKDIFERIGGNLRSFEFSGGYIMDEHVKQNMIEGVTNKCPRIHSLTINYVQFSNESFQRLQESFCKLKYLDLSRCSIDETSLGITLDGERFKAIKILRLAGNSSMEGSFFKQMKYVENLDISFCFNLSFFELLEFLQNCLQLKVLSLSASSFLLSTGDQNFLQILLNHQPNLERLLMVNTGVVRDEETLSKFKNLKYSSFEGRKFGT